MCLCIICEINHYSNLYTAVQVMLNQFNVRFMDVPLTKKYLSWDKDANNSFDTQQMYEVYRFMLCLQAAIPQDC